MFPGTPSHVLQHDIIKYLSGNLAPPTPLWFPLQTQIEEKANTKYVIKMPGHYKAPGTALVAWIVHITGLMMRNVVFAKDIHSVGV